MTKRNFAMAVALALVAVTPGLVEAEEAEETKTGNSVVVEVSNLKTDEGPIRCSIFSEEEGFPGEVKKADKKMWVQPKSKKATCIFDGMKPGTYAVAVMHDLDKNGELNTSFVGRPKEWWGVSNNAPAHRFGPPKFEEAKFQYEGGKKTLKVKLQL